MSFKKGLIVTGVVLALAVPATAFAATSDSAAAVRIRGLFGIDGSKLTTAQQADVKDYAQKMADLQKGLLDKMVSDGALTQAQADTQKAQIDSNLANGDVFFGGGKGPGDHEGMPGGPGMPGKRGGMDISKLTDAQKNSLLTLEKQQISLKDDLAQLMVDQKLITQAQADTIKKNADAEAQALTSADPKPRMMDWGMDGLGMLRGVTLTDAQKSALLGWTAKSAAVQKQIVALFKDAGVITQAQADSMNTQIDNRASDPLSGMMMDGRGRMGGGHGR